MRLTRPPHSKQARTQTGLSLIEMMVGITVGMIVVAGASLMMTQQLNEHRRLVLETQVQQDLRAASDLILRELRRAGSMRQSAQFVWAPGAAAPLESNAYGKLTKVNKDQNQVLYGYSSNSPSTEDNQVIGKESFGFQVVNKVLQFSLGDNNWQPLTDPEVLLITNFSIVSKPQTLLLDELCEKPCAGAANCPPQLTVNYFEVTLSARAKHDAQVVRTLRVNSRTRNDEISGACAP